MEKIFLNLLLFLAFTSYCQTGDGPHIIRGSFKVDSIKRQKDVYIIIASKDGIDYKIASPDSYRPKDSKKIKAGQTYEFVLRSFLPGNHFEISGVEVSPNNIVKVGNDLDLYKALNLKGIFHISAESIDTSPTERRIPEYIEGLFRIDKIRKSKNVYIIYASDEKNTYKIVSPMTSPYDNNHKKIQKKNFYKMVLFSFKNDDNRSVKKFEIAPKNFIHVEKKTGQLYESSDLNGLYYTRDE